MCSCVYHEEEEYVRHHEREQAEGPVPGATRVCHIHIEDLEHVLDHHRPRVLLRITCLLDVLLEQAAVEHVRVEPLHVRVAVKLDLELIVLHRTLHDPAVLPPVSAAFHGDIAEVKGGVLGTVQQVVVQ